MRKGLALLCLLFLNFYTLIFFGCKSKEKENSIISESEVNPCLYCHKKKNIKNCKEALDNMTKDDCLDCHQGSKYHHGFKINMERN